MVLRLTLHRDLTQTCFFDVNSQSSCQVQYIVCRNHRAYAQNELTFSGFQLVFFKEKKKKFEGFDRIFKFSSFHVLYINFFNEDRANLQIFIFSRLDKFSMKMDQEDREDHHFHHTFARKPSDRTSSDPEKQRSSSTLTVDQSNHKALYQSRSLSTSPQSTSSPIIQKLTRMDSYRVLPKLNSPEASNNSSSDCGGGFCLIYLRTD